MLECTVCHEGYSLRDGQCFKTCNTNIGQSIVNGVCANCTDINCVDCTGNVSVCKKCSTLFTLSNGTCLTTCPANFTQVPAEFFSTQCLP